MSGYNLAMPCRHAPAAWKYRVSTHSDREVDAAGGIANLDGAFASVWVCGRDECVERGKSYIAATTLRTPVLNEGAIVRERPAS